jgi:CheY-like chemotaxis protein
MKSHVLIAEPDRVAADELRQFLSWRGYFVEIASGGLGTLERIRRGALQVVVMSTDLRWGGCDGILEVMRSGNDVPPVPVVLVETNGESRDRAEFAGPPIVRRLHKPFAPVELFDILEGLTHHRTVNSGP